MCLWTGHTSSAASLLCSVLFLLEAHDFRAQLQEARRCTLQVTRRATQADGG